MERLRIDETETDGSEQVGPSKLWIEFSENGHSTGGFSPFGKSKSTETQSISVVDSDPVWRLSNEFAVPMDSKLERVTDATFGKAKHYLKDEQFGGAIVAPFGIGVHPAPRIFWNRCGGHGHCFAGANLIKVPKTPILTIGKYRLNSELDYTKFTMADEDPQIPNSGMDVICTCINDI